MVRLLRAVHIDEGLQAEPQSIAGPRELAAALVQLLQSASNYHSSSFKSQLGMNDSTPVGVAAEVDLSFRHAGRQRKISPIFPAEPPMPLTLVDILILAVVQGFTEFLPVSSSGHLVVLSAWMSGGVPGQLDVADLNVVLHIGTLFSIIVFYWQRIWRLVGEDRRVIRLLVIGTIPAVVLGLTIKLTCEQLVENPLLAGLMLPITGLMLLWAERHMQGQREYRELSDRQALLIGLSQSAAILPGLSRSGTTICAGLGLDLSPKSAATFSFLLAIPAIAGAGLLTTIKLVRHPDMMTTPWQHLLIGGLVSFVVGLFALHWLIRWLEAGRLRLFAWWCIPLGIGVTIWQLCV